MGNTAVESKENIRMVWSEPRKEGKRKEEYLYLGLLVIDVSDKVGDLVNDDGLENLQVYLIRFTCGW